MKSVAAVVVTYNRKNYLKKLSMRYCHRAYRKLTC
ncbi:Protein of unknown function [Lactobacillus delbrueckii subsp. lactis]|nr:Protein of unknown function [Lactobacillus delbrueckii subsp. lactis]